MNEKRGEFLESDLARRLVEGVAFAGAGVFLILAVASGVAALAVSPWWVVGFILAGLLCGLLAGLGVFVLDQSW